MNVYRPSRRNWVKLWVNEWFDATVRFEMTLEERSLWIDLIALAGRSRFPGLITPGKTNGKYMGYPVSFLAGTICTSEEKLKKALDIFELHNRITIKDGVIEIVNWEKYQSEYHQKLNRNADKATRKARLKRNSAKVTESVSEMYDTSKSNMQSLEEEVEGEVEVEGEEEDAKNASSTAPASPEILKAFGLLGAKPFGPASFQQLWMHTSQEYDGKTTWLSDIMEKTAISAKAMGVQVPGRFFVLKHEIEKIDAKDATRVTPI